MDEITRMLLNIQEEMKQLKTDNKDMENRITSTIIQKIDDKFEKIEQKHKIMEEKIEKQEQRLKYVEKEMRKKNILIFGVPETDSSYEKLENNILHLVNNTMKVHLTRPEIEAATRRGKKEENKVRPIVLTLTTLGTKIRILKSKKTLEHTNYYIKEDFTPEIQEKRKLLSQEVKKLREEGKNAVLKYDQIIVLKKRPDSNTNNKQNSNKRNMSKSPETSSTVSNKETFNRTSKKNKIVPNSTLTSYWPPRFVPTSQESETNQAQTQQSI